MSGDPIGHNAANVHLEGGMTEYTDPMPAERAGVAQLKLQVAVIHGCQHFACTNQGASANRGLGNVSLLRSHDHPANLRFK